MKKEYKELITNISDHLLFTVLRKADVFSPGLHGHVLLAAIIFRELDFLCTA